MSNTTFPDSAICYLLDDIPGQGEFKASGVIIGPHTILTAAHFVYDADTGVSADAISVYPGFVADGTTYNPPGALGGLQSIHYVKVADNNEELSAAATQSDFAIIDTSTDLSRYGRFALDPDFTSGGVVVRGYPASNNGYLTGTGGVVSQDGTLSDLDTSRLSLSPGYSGGPISDVVERDGTSTDAVVGTVSTNIDAMKLTRAKVALIRHWIASDKSLYAGGQDAPRGLVPQIAGTVSNSVNAAPASASQGTAPLAAGTGEAASSLADLAAALHGPSSAGDTAPLVPTGADAGATLVPPAHADRTGYDTFC